MNLHKLLLVVWILLLVAGILGLVYEQVSLSRTETVQVGPFELRRPASRQIEIPRPLAVGTIAVGASLTLYTIFFRLE